MTRILRFCAILIVGIASPALAQQTGSILVTAVDEQKAMVPGATITISSPVMPREMAGVTDSTGVYRVPGLTVGRYTVKVSLQGFQTVVREDVIVIQGQTAAIEIPMKVSSLSESVTVKGESPTVDPKSTTVKVNLDKNLLESTPGGKDIWNILEYKAPGINFDTPDVGGNQAGLQRAFTARGTPNSQNTQMLNGVTVNDPAAQGFSMNYYDPSSFENIQVSTGSQDISVGTAGVFVNMVTKSGSNKFNGQFLQTCQGNCKVKTQSGNIDQTLLNAGFRSDSNSVDYVTNTNGQAGGPLVRNKLFYFGSINYQPTHVFVPGFPAVAPPQVPTQLNTSNQDTTNILTGTGKLNYQFNPSHRFEVYGSKQRYDKPNRGASASNTQDSDTKEYDFDNTAQVAWNAVLSDRMFVDTRLSYNNVHFPLYQKTAQQSLLDNSTSIRYRNAATTQIMFRRRLELVSNWQYYLPTFLGGRHEFKVGFDNGYTPEDVDNLRVDNVNLVFLSLPTVRASTVTLFNSPIHLRRAVMSTAIYGQDSYSIKRLTVIGGLRWERIEGYLPAQQTPVSQYFPEGLVFQGITLNGVVQDYTVKKSFDPVRQDPLWHNFAPRGSATYDIRGNGKTVAKLAIGRYLDQINTGTPPNPNGTISQTYNWNDTNGDLIFQPGTLTWNGKTYVGGELGTQSGGNTIPNPLPFDRTVRRPKRNELVVGVDHELFPNVLLSASYIHRNEHDVQATIDQSIDQWASTYSLKTLTDLGRDGVLGTSDDTPIQVYNLNNASTVISTKTINDDRLATRYNGIELDVTKRYSNGWTVLGGYNYGIQHTDILSLNNPNNAYVNAAGESGGRRHNFKANGSFTLPYQIVVGADFRLQSGLPITRTWAISACSTTVTTNCLNQAVTVNAEPRGSVYLPWLPTADARIGRFFRSGPNRLELSLDVYNISNSNTTYAVRTTTGTTPIRVGGDPTVPTTQIASFLSPTGVLGPRIVRFNVTYQFGQK